MGAEIPRTADSPADESLRVIALKVMNQLLIPLLGLTGIPALLEFLEVRLAAADQKQDGRFSGPSKCRSSCQVRGACPCCGQRLHQVFGLVCVLAVTFIARKRELQWDGSLLPRTSPCCSFLMGACSVHLAFSMSLWLHTLPEILVTWQSSVFREESRSCTRSSYQVAQLNTTCRTVSAYCFAGQVRGTVTA